MAEELLWSPLVRDYSRERFAESLALEKAADDPLLRAASRFRGGGEGKGDGGKDDDDEDDEVKGGADEDAESKRTTSLDPLSAMMEGEFDPLGALGGPSLRAAPDVGEVVEVAAAPVEGKGEDGSSSVPGSGASSGASGAAIKKAKDPWDVAKGEILKEYTVSDKIKVTASFMDQMDNKEDAQTKSLGGDKTKNRLQQLDAGKEDEQFEELSQKEYMQRIEHIHLDLREAWNNGERVLTLKLAIQCAKVLVDLDVPAFYPSMFVLVTEVLDTFGNLVFERIKNRSIEMHKAEGAASVPSLAADFSASDVHIKAKETCRNWLYKIACIRELLPRLYIEIALVQCYRFLSDQDEYIGILKRLSSVVRGVGDPLIAVYARCYLARAGQRALPGHRDYLMQSIYDYMFTFNQLTGYADDEEDGGGDGGGAKKAEAEADCALPKEIESGKGLRMVQYLRLHRPAVAWLLSVAGKGAPKADFIKALQHFRDYSGSSMVLRHIIASFDSGFYSQNALGMVRLIKEAKPHEDPTRLLTALARGLAAHPPPEAQRMPLLNEAWKIVGKQEDLGLYVECSAAFIELLLAHFSDKKVLVLLKDLLKHLGLGKSGTIVEAQLAAARDDVRPHLEKIMAAVVKNMADIDAVATSSPFMQLLDLFQSDKKSAICKDLLEACNRVSEATSDTVIIHTLFDVARNLHDSIDSLTVVDERRQIANLIIGFIDKIDFGTDLEQQLNIYVDCRAAFSNLDSVMERLVLCVAQLAVRAHRLMRGKHSRKTSAFVKACLAYCHITVPSIGRVLRRFQLFYYCGQVALFNVCLPQVDTFFKSAIALIPDIPAHETVNFERIATEDPLASMLRSFIGTLTVVPGHPEHGAFYLVTGFINAVERYPWRPESGAKTSVLMGVLPVLCAYAQARLPFKVPGVESNDDLYGGNDGYLHELRETLNGLVQSLWEQLSEMEKGEGTTAVPKRTRVELITELVNILMTSVKLEGKVGYGRV